MTSQSSIWGHVKEAQGAARRTAQPLYDRFLSTTAGAAFSRLSPRWKVATGIVAGLTLLTGMRLIGGLLRPEHHMPPPAYQGAYNRIRSMTGSSIYPHDRLTDFGSGLTLNKAVRRRVPTAGHHALGRTFTGVTL